MKQKRFLCFAMAALMGLSVMGLAACGGNESAGHEHTYRWAYDEDQHWEEPTCNDGAENRNYGEHHFENGVCRECGMPEPQESGELSAVTYPTDPNFPTIDKDKDEKYSYKAHDPVIVEAVRTNGVSRYWSFSTDNDGGYGVQVRSSSNLSRWTFQGTAIKGFQRTVGNKQVAFTSEDDVKALYTDSNFHLYPVYNWLRNDSAWGTGCWTLWAPDVVPASDNPGMREEGHWWMYSCWTTGFGSSRSIIFKLNADNIAGPYTFDTVIVRDNPGQDGNLNEIDPSIYYSADGSRMFMSYGSFFGGFGVIELDPETGHRKNAEEADTVAGKKMVTASGFDAEGSSVAYYERDVYTGNIAAEDYDETKWEKQGKYVMMASDGALAYNYVMRTWESDTPDGPFTSTRGGYGFQVGGNWSWRHQGDPDTNETKVLNYYIPGHNDMLTTREDLHLIGYHVRVSEAIKDGNPAYNEGEHFLYLSMFDFNSKGQLVINPNRYAGEKIGIVTAADLTAKTQGKYSVIQMTSSDVAYTTKREVCYAQDCTFGADGTISGAVTGSWKLYGSHYIYIKIGADEYYGTVMPAWIRQYKSGAVIGNGGLTISAVTEVSGGQNKIIYFNMQF